VRQWPRRLRSTRSGKPERRQGQAPSDSRSLVSLVEHTPGSHEFGERFIDVLMNLRRSNPIKNNGLNVILERFCECRSSIASGHAHFGYKHSTK
jgi:hypothetical protein